MLSYDTTATLSALMLSITATSVIWLWLSRVQLAQDWGLWGEKGNKVLYREISHKLGKGWRRQWQPTPVFLPGESQGQSCLAGYSPWGRKESDRTERPTLLPLAGKGTWFYGDSVSLLCPLTQNCRSLFPLKKLNCFSPSSRQTVRGNDGYKNSFR